VKRFKKLRKSIGVGLAVFVALVIYAYGFQVTKVNLDETRSPRRQEQLVRIIRALVKPDILAYEKEEFQVNVPIMVPCPANGYTPPAPDKNNAYMILSPTCADPGSEITVEGFGFAINQKGPIHFIPPSEVSLQMGDIQTDSQGHFLMTVKLPKRPTEELQKIRAITRRNVGAPHITQTAIDTWDKIVETVFLALLATTLGTALAAPLSFLAARNLMKDITSSVTSVALSLLAIPAGVALGVTAAQAFSSVSQSLNQQILISILGLILLPLIAWYLARWSLPQEELTRPLLSLRIRRLLAMIVASVAFILSLYLFSNVLLKVGDSLATQLGAFAFLGNFIADLGDILGMTMVVLLALLGAGLSSSITGRIGQWISRDLPHQTARFISLPLAAVAGAVLTALLGAGIDWLYQVNDPLNTFWIPAGIGAIIGLALAIRLSREDTLPTGMVIYYLARTVFNALRSIEALIMVIVFVVWVGIGPFAGVLALSLHTVAALAKLYSEQVESILQGPIEAVRATGATRLQTIIYAVIPQIVPPYISFTMYRWDINVRMSTIIGFAGGGGIGFLLMQNINLLNYRAASAQMLAIAIVVASMDYLSSKLREMTI